MQAAFPHRSLVTTSDFLVRSRQERLVPLAWGGACTSRTGREVGNSQAAADKVAKLRFIPHYPPLSCSAGRCHVALNNCCVPLARWLPCDGWGEHEGSPRLAPAKLFFHLRNSASLGETYHLPRWYPLRAPALQKASRAPRCRPPFYTQMT